MNKYSISSYDDIAKSADAHLKFYQMVKSVVSAAQFDDGSKQSLAVVTSAIEVGSKPFSISKHISTLDMRSDEWELFEADRPTMEGLLEAHQYFKSIEPSYDTGGAILGFAQACERVGLDPDAKSAVVPKDHGVTFAL